MRKMNIFFENQIDPLAFFILDLIISPWVLHLIFFESFLIVIAFLFLKCHNKLCQKKLFRLSILIYVLFSFALYKLNFYITKQSFSPFTLLNLEINSFSLYFLILTSFIMVFCIFNVSLEIKQYKAFIIYLVLIELFLIISFTTTNLVVFYVFFESVLIPMFLIVGKWGSRERKIKAAFYLFVYTLLGSFFLLCGIFYLYLITGSVQYQVILNHKYLSSEIVVLFWLLFIPFAFKIPMFPAHIWLPEAHVEAPTIGSVILASLLLKLGGYGIIKILLPIMDTNTEMLPIVYTIATAGVLFGSLSTIRQIDLKKIIAYSSIAHMNLIVLALFSANKIALYGAIYFMIAHGFVSSGLFFCIGILYDRYHTRLIRYYGGLVQIMPVFSILFLFFTLANTSFPGTANFVGELIMLIGIAQSEKTWTNVLILPTSAISIILSAIYSIWAYNKIVFGTLKTKYISKFLDITVRETITLLSLVTWTLLLGLISVGL